MSKGLRMLRWGTTIAVCAGSLAAAQAQQVERREAQPFAQQDLQQLWEQQKAQMRARIGGAMQQLQAACGEELRSFCGTVTPGEGRLLLCMQAHEDKLGRGCGMALLETSRSIGSAISRVERFAEACWNDIQTFCRTAGGSITQCVVDNRSSLSRQCQAIIAATQTGAQPGQAQQPGQGQQPGQQPPLTGLAIYSMDGTKLGEVTGVKRRPDGSVESIEADLGSPLGLGTTGVLISPSDLHMKGDHIELQMAADQVRSILQGQRR
jgi:Golgi apparatus protein 1